MATYKQTVQNSYDKVKRLVCGCGCLLIPGLLFFGHFTCSIYRLDDAQKRRDYKKAYELSAYLDHFSEGFEEHKVFSYLDWILVDNIKQNNLLELEFIKEKLSLKNYFSNSTPLKNNFYNLDSSVEELARSLSLPSRYAKFKDEEYYQKYISNLHKLPGYLDIYESEKLRTFITIYGCYINYTSGKVTKLLQENNLAQAENIQKEIYTTLSTNSTKSKYHVAYSLSYVNLQNVLAQELLTAAPKTKEAALQQYILNSHTLLNQADQNCKAVKKTLDKQSDQYACERLYKEFTSTFQVFNNKYPHSNK